MIRQILLCLVAAAATWGQELPELVGRLGYVYGQVSFRAADAREWAPANTNEPLSNGDALRTGADSQADGDLALISFPRNRMGLQADARARLGRDVIPFHQDAGLARLPGIHVALNNRVLFLGDRRRLPLLQLKGRFQQYNQCLGAVLVEYREPFENKWCVIDGKHSLCGPG